MPDSRSHWRGWVLAALGERFDIRRFHMAVLDTGAVPLPVLEQSIEEWIEGEKTATR